MQGHHSGGPRRWKIGLDSPQGAQRIPPQRSLLRMSEALMSVRGGSPKLGLALPALDLFGAQRKAVRNGSHHQDERDLVQHGLVL